MAHPKTTKIVPLSGLKITGQQPNSIRLGGNGVYAEITALANDLFRFRSGRGRYTPATASCAIEKTEWHPITAGISSRKNKVAVATESGAMLIDLESGAWEIFVDGGSLFQAAPGGSRFSGSKAGLSLGLVEGEALFGLGESTGTFDRRGSIRDFWNIDVLGHSPCIHPHLQQLYVSIPFALSLRDGRAGGLFWDNPSRQRWDLGLTAPDVWKMEADSGGIDLYFFLGPTAPQILNRYTELTGRMPLPPQWALGFQQCRYSYETRDRVEEIAREFRERQLPCDAIYLDIHHMDGYRVFTFGKDFPRPAQMITNLRRKGFKIIPIVDPGVKDDPNFGVLKRGCAADAFVKSADGVTDALGEAWPGACRFPDFMNPRARAWWGREQRALQEAGVAGFWADMNEPANFARPDKTLALDAVHRTEAGPVPHSGVHNLYGFQMARALREGSLANAPDERPFVVTRAGCAGIQRHAAIWTGDNSSHWDHLRDSLQMILNLSLSGVPFCGADVGGFRGHATPELFTRWFQLAALTPFFRNHSDIGTVAQELWAFGEEVEQACRHYLKLRYRLLPYLYNLFAEARESGTPIVRPLFWHYQNDPMVTRCGTQFLLGRNLLVAPVLEPGATARSVYLTNDIWCDFWTGEVHQGGRHILVESPLDTLPLFVRAGAVIPMIETQQFVGEKAVDTVELHCWAGGCDELNWYEDDGHSQRSESGEFCRRTITATTFKRTLTLRFGAESGTYPTRVKTWRLAIWGAKRSGKLRVNGRVVPGSHDSEARLFAADLPNIPGTAMVEFAGL